MKVVSVINYKGGVGKTTISCNLAAGISRSRRVLAIDLDPQANLTFSLISVPIWRQYYEDKRTIKNWFDAIVENRFPLPSLKDLVIPANKGVDIISSHLGLIDIDMELATLLSGGTPNQYKKNYIRTYSYLRNELKTLEDSYDLIIIDCPPNFSMVTKNALIASDFYAVPAKMDYLSTLGINQLRNHIQSLVKEYNSYCDETQKADPKLAGVVATMIAIRDGKPISAQQEYITQLKKSGIPLFSSMVRENKTLFSGGADSDPVILQYYPSGTYSIVVHELEKLQIEFMKKVGI